PVQRSRHVAMLVAIRRDAALAQIQGAATGVIRGPELLDQIGGVGAGRPGMSVVADFGIDVEIVEDAELAGQRMRVWRRGLAKQRERRVAVAALEVAENLIVRPVLANDIE